jgi:hypothetical protein
MNAAQPGGRPIPITLRSIRATGSGCPVSNSSIIASRHGRLTTKKAKRCPPLPAGFGAASAGRKGRLPRDTEVLSDFVEANERRDDALHLESGRHLDKFFNLQNRSRNVEAPDDVDTSGRWRARRMSSSDFG